MKNINNLLYGFTIGIVNSILGAGAGIIAVACFKNQGFKQNEAHANSICLMLCVTLVSAFNYLLSDFSLISNALFFIPLGLLGSFLGSFILPILPDKLLKRFFAIFIIFSGLRMIFK